MKSNGPTPTPPSNLLAQVAEFTNLYQAFRQCSRGKKQSAGYQVFLLNYGEQLWAMHQELATTGNYHFASYREFFVHDPKKRLIMAAPFGDRVVHTAICQVIFPILDALIPKCSYACRPQMGNYHALQRLRAQLKLMGQQRYVIKLDVRQYFASIPHGPLLALIDQALPDQSLTPLLASLLASHPHYRQLQRGIPIGNLTSQLFANFYLASLDQLACSLLAFDPSAPPHPNGAYLRYMDDLVIIGATKAQALASAQALIEHATEKLELAIPPNKFMPLANDPVPFLGFVLASDYYRPLRRNLHRMDKRRQRWGQSGWPSLSLRAQVEQSFQAWCNLEK